jgi:hypothetical protein
MPRKKDLKRLVRARMRKTGESYTAARSTLVRKNGKRKSETGSGHTDGATLESLDYATLADMRDATIHNATGRDWAGWVAVLDAHDARSMKHGVITRLLSETYSLPGWWTQMVAVGYERIRGLRAIGQRLDGTFEAVKSKTMSVSATKLYDAWAKAPMRRKWLDAPGLRVTTATRPRSLRIRMDDGTIVAVFIESKGRTKSTVHVQHTKVRDRATVSRLRELWGARLADLQEMLGTGKRE